MTRLGRFLLSYVLWMASSCGKLEGQTFAMTVPVAQQLQQVAADSLEHVYCLHGLDMPDTLLISVAIPVPLTFSTPHNAGSTVGCLGLAVWHNHPVPADSAPAAYLYFTMTDQHTFLTYEQAPLAIVGVRSGAWCTWTRSQVKKAWDLHLVPLRPIEGQCHG
jgi:hypothetical protein